MNEPYGYASLEASKRLVDAGIVLETDFYHNCYSKEYNLWNVLYWGDKPKEERISIPAPSMVEVWRKLPKQKTFIQKGESFSICFLGDWKHDEEKLYHLEYHSELFFDENPIDALIDLLIWVRKEQEK